MIDEQSKQPPLSERVFEHWFVTLPWIVFVGALFVFVGIPFANMLVVCWVKGADAYFHQGICIPLGHGLHFSDGSKVPQWPLFLTLFPTFMVIVGVPSFALIHILRFYERRKKRAGGAVNNSLQATRDGRSSSAARFTSFGPAWLSSGR